MDQSQMVAVGGAIGAIFGAMAAFLTAWMRGRNDLAKVVDARIKLMLERDEDIIAIQRSEIDALKADLHRLNEEHGECNKQIEGLREEIRVLRARVQDISEPEEY